MYQVTKNTKQRECIIIIQDTPPDMNVLNYIITPRFGNVSALKIHQKNSMYQTIRLQTIFINVSFGGIK